MLRISLWLPYFQASPSSISLVGISAAVVYKWRRWCVLPFWPWTLTPCTSLPVTRTAGSQAQAIPSEAVACASQLPGDSDNPANRSEDQREQLLPESKRWKRKGSKWLFLSMAFYPCPHCYPEFLTPNFYHHLVRIASNWRVQWQRQNSYEIVYLGRLSNHHPLHPSSGANQP